MTQLYNYEDLERLVIKLGFLPFFKNEIVGFSVEEYTPSHLWFSKEEEGPWEWKGPVALNGNCVYGKFFKGKAGFVSRKWFAELVNYRRTAYSINTDVRNNSNPDKASLIYDTVIKQESLLSKEIKKICGKEGYDSAITRLQMGTWLIVADFEYQYDKHLNPYGWGIARYTTPEALYGIESVQLHTQQAPEESKQHILEYLTSLLPEATRSQIHKLIE